MFNIAISLPRCMSDAAVEIIPALVEFLRDEKDSDTRIFCASFCSFSPFLVSVNRLSSALLHLLYCNSEATQLALALDLPTDNWDKSISATMADIQTLSLLG